MPLRISNRKYTGPALEFWLSKLATDWEKGFSRPILARGRKIYRRGAIKAVELGDEDAIVHGKVDDFDGYVVLDWKGTELAIRSSTVERDVGQALAVAGMYEVEELVGEEVAPLAPDMMASSSATETPSPKEDEAAPAPSLPSQDADEVSGDARELLLQFSTTEKGLVFSAFWKTATGQRVPALGEHAAPAEAITHREREQLIRLAHSTRKAGFHFRLRESHYILEELERAPGFIRNELPTWSPYFLVELDAEAEALKRGIQEVDVIARADAHEQDRFDLQWDLHLADSVLSEEEGRWLARRGHAPSILPGRGLVRLKEDEADVLSDWLEAFGDRCGDALPRYMLFSLFGQSELKILLTPELRAWRDALFNPASGSQATDERLAFLRTYQRFGVHWLAHMCDSGCHGLLADEMGLGKTLQVLSLLATRPASGKPSLIVCPASVVPVWLGEIQRFYPHLNTSVVRKGHHFGIPSDADAAEWLWICSYTQLRRHKAELQTVEFGYAVLDEAQFIKNPEAKVTLACLHLQAAHRIALTGTPLENRFLDVWTLFRFLMPGLLGGRRKFERRLKADPFGTMQKVRTQIAPFVLRRTKREVAKDLPKKVHNELVCPLTDLQRTEYTRLAQKGIDAFGQDLQQLASVQSLNFLSLLTRLRQCCCDPDLLPWVHADWQQSGKIVVLVDRLTELIANQHKVVIFSQFVTMLERVEAAISEQFPQTPMYRLTGKTVDRKTPVDMFQERDGSGIFLVSLRAGGTGITLNTAEYVFLLDPWWNPAVEEQAIDRVHRIGQKRTVFVYSMVTQGTLEARIQKLKIHKRDLFEQAIGAFAGSSEFDHYFRSLSELIELAE